MRKKSKIISALIFLLLPIAASAQNVLPNPGLFGLSNAPIYDIILNFVKWLLSIFGFLAIIAFVISGVQYLLSAGDEDSQKRAKRTLTYAITGVVVGLGGLVIIYAIQKVLGGSTTQF
jgi:hypothetical protein